MSIRIITINVNGIRSAARKGFFDWLNQQQADVVCLQETRAQQEQLTDEIFYPAGYNCYYLDAEKKGYSGVALYCKLEPKAVTSGLGWHTADTEGRYLEADFGKLKVASVYLPSGTSGDARQQLKFDFLDQYLAILKKQVKSTNNYIICGDFNIAHKEIDLKNWRSNQKNSGFLPEERAWMENLFTKVGFIDTFRHLYPEREQYTWWSNRGKAWENNTGWRIDYQIASPRLQNSIKRAAVYREEKFSDHAPLIAEYDLSF